MGGFTGTNDWKYISLYLQAPDNASRIRFENFLETGTGTAWFDGLKIEPYISSNNISNNGFEQITNGSGNGWTNLQGNGWLVYNASGTPSVTIDSTTAQEGSNSLKSSVTSYARVSVYRDIPVIAGNWYTASFYVKTQGATGNGAQLRVQFFNTAGAGVGIPYYAGNVSGTNDWKLIQAKVRVLSDATTLRFENLFDANAGTAWFDNDQLSTPIRDDIYKYTDKNIALSNRESILDPNCSSIQFVIDTPPANGVLDLSANGSWAYTPYGNYAGYDSLKIMQISGSGAVMMNSYQLFVAPSGADVVSSVISKYPNNEHPRLLATTSDFSRINSLKTTDSNAFAVGYDWLYSWLSSSQKNEIKNAIRDKGLKPGITSYNGGTDFFVTTDNNWNLVCNSGLGTGVLAIADDEPTISGQVLQASLKSIQNGLSGLGYNGSCNEGPTYWNFGIDYLVIYLASLNNAADSDYGISGLRRIADAAGYCAHITGPKGLFNYADGGDGSLQAEQNLWFSNKYNKPEFSYKIGGYQVLDLPYYRTGNMTTLPTTLDQSFSPIEEISMRSAWGDPNATFIGFKAGCNGWSHGDLDIGSFVLDALGYRWALDLGAEDYGLPGYWDNSYQRWTYYRKRAEAHNTLVINPNSGVDQNINATAKLITAQSNAQQAFAIADLTDAYKSSVQSVRRGIQLLNNRSQVILQDEIQTLAASEIYWFMSTKASISVAHDGLSATLTQGDKRLWIKILSPNNGASFTTMNAVPSPTSPNPPSQTANIGIQKLTIHLTNVTSTTTTISLWMVPLNLADPIPTSYPAVKALNYWAVVKQ